MNKSQFSDAIQRKVNWQEKILKKEIYEKYIAEAVNEGLDEQSARKVVETLQINACGDPRIVFKDDLDPELGKALEIALDKIANSPHKDCHPFTDGKVQDLIHPSLYPYVHKKTKVIWRSREKVAAYGNVSGPQFKTHDRPVEVSNFQWLPTVFRATSSGTKIEKYINNLSLSHDNLYKLIGQVFSHAVPLFEQSLNMWPGELQYTDLQVIVKAANYVIKPGENYYGNWHVEGMTHEQIVASAIYYYSSSSNIEDAGLSFRRERKVREDYPQLYKYDVDDNRPPEGLDHWEMNVVIGTVPTTQGRLLVFPNDIQHCVTTISNSSETEVAYRKILCFFLVNPKVNLISTKDVPEQQWDRIKLRSATRLTLVSRRMGTPLPKEIVLMIVEKARFGFTWEEAQQIRLDLMKERKYFVNEQNKEMERKYSLCEH